MKRIFIFAVMAFSTLAAAAQEQPLWMRYPAISPDGETIVFSYKGDLFCVPTTGGSARQLTTNAAYDSQPIWSPDGQKIAFVSDREGSLDIYVVNRNGGTPKRLTTASSDERPVTWSDNDHVLYSCALMPTAESNLFASSAFQQIYEVSVRGERPRLYSTLPMENMSIDNKGRVLYHDKKGYEDPWRKHHQSAICRDIWLFEPDGASTQRPVSTKERTGRYTQQTTFRGEDRNPIWASDGQSFYYLSETDGTSNVWYRQLNSTTQRQITHHLQNPVRFLTMANNGTLCYGYDGEIYINKGGEEQKVNIRIIADRNDTDLKRQILTSGAKSISLSPNGKEIAFVAHGDVYVTSIDYKTTKQITNTPEQERSISFSPDGRSVVYDAERNGHWQIYRTSIKKADEKSFTYATELEEEQLINSGITSLQPKYSPDGKEVAFFEDRGALRVLNLASKQVRTVLDAQYNYSYSDGDLWFEWSPDSKWLLASYIGTGGWNSPDVALVSAAGNKVVNLTQSGYSDANAKWALGGKAIIYESDRAGYRSHGSWGAESDVYMMFFDDEAYARFRMTKEEKQRYDEAQKEAEDKAKEAAKNQKDKKKGKDKDAKNAQQDFVLNEALLDDCRDRIVRLTVNSSHLADFALSPKGDTLYYCSRFEGEADLWKHDLLEDRTEIVLKGVGSGALVADKSFKNLFISGSSIKKIDLSKGKSENIAFEAPFNYRPYEERQYIYNHVLQQVTDKFYEPGMQGVDWKTYGNIYRKFLPHINNNYDFSEMLSELLGELNASHTGARYYADGASLTTGKLPVFIDPSYEGNGLRIQEVLKRSDLALKGVKNGSIITHIDGFEIESGKDYYPLLDGKIGKPVRLTIAYNGQSQEVSIKPLSQSALANLLYKRWVERNRQLVDSLSGGRLAYVHVKAMDSETFREVYSKLLSDDFRNRQAVIVDERHNGGGWLHDDLCTLLSGYKYHDFVPHGKFVGVDPYNKWTKPSCVMMCEDDYSNGEGFPWVYKELKIGKLIGTPVAGTATSVWWERQIDSDIVFGIPQVGKIDRRGKYTENNELFPDIEVYNMPEDYITGHDRQLEKAIEEMMKNTAR